MRDLLYFFRGKVFGKGYVSKSLLCPEGIVVLGLEPVGSEGGLGGIFVKTPPKTSKNASFENSGFVGKERAVGFG